MAYNLGTVATEIHRHLGFHPKFDTQMLYDAVNKGQEEVSKFIRHIRDFWYINTILGADGKYVMEYVFAPMTVLEVHAATCDGVPMKELTLEEWNNTTAEESTRTGTPCRYIIMDTTTNGKAVLLWPRPDKAYKIQCPVTVVPDEMASAEEIPVIRRDCRDSMVLFGAYWCARQVGDAEFDLRAKFLFDLYQRQIVIDKAALQVNEVIKTKRRR